ncbi:MAG: IS21 family transposase [Spirochaetia bacterium]|nr:IS21 family transposase [Spirochaetia bacterium]
MLKMSQVERIKQMVENGYSLKTIQDDVGCSYKTVKKYLEKDDFNEALPIRKTSGRNKIHMYQDEIIAIIDSCKHNWEKHRITGQRVYDLLLERHKEIEISYETVQRFVKRHKASARLQQQRGFEELVWHPGEAQADFGEADFLRPDGTTERLKFFQLSFPHSNMFYTQIYRGENGECVCQGLKNIFEYLGKVPNLIVFDNATGIGHRIAEILKESRLFTQFKLQYGFVSRYCNPNSGHEKGSVENSVGFTRRNMFTPLIEIPFDVESFNTNELFVLCEKLKEHKIHYKKKVRISLLMQEDLQSMMDLPAIPLIIKKVVSVKTDSYGKFVLSKHHWYTLASEHAFKNLLVETYAWDIKVYTETGEYIETFERKYGTDRTDTVHIETMINNIIYKPGAWPNSKLRESIGKEDPFSLYMDKLPTKSDRKNLLKLVQEIMVTFDADTVLYACQDLAKNGQTLSRANITTLSNRITTFPTDKSNNCTGVDLSKFDFLLKRGQ